MNAMQTLYQEKCCTAETLLEVIEDRDYLVSAQAAAEPQAILSKLHLLKNRGVKDVVLQTCLPIMNYPVFQDQEMDGVVQHNCWFFNASQRKIQPEGMVSHIPQNSCTALSKGLSRALAEGRRPVVLATVAPMDEHGYLSLSISAIYEMELVKAGAVVLLEVNPNYPRTFGDTMIHISQVTALVESDRPIPAIAPAPYTAVDEAIGKHIATLVPDGSTIQLGIGNIPNAVAAELKSKKHLGIHTEMFTESMMDLIECGAVDNSQKGLNDGYSVCSFTMGSQRLYQFLDNNPSILFKAATYSNDPYTIGLNRNFVSINASLEIDLSGQCASEAVGHRQHSGTGGQSETVQGAQRSPGGKSIIAMHSTFTKKEADGTQTLCSKIVPFLSTGAIVSTSRNDVDYVVTEYGIAWLRGANMKTRVEALIAIAHPDFRDGLAQEAKKHQIW